MPRRAATRLAALVLAGALAGCGDGPAPPGGPEASEVQVLQDAAEMLPPDPSATPAPAATSAAAD